MKEAHTIKYVPLIIMDNNEQLNYIKYFFASNVG